MTDTLKTCHKCGEAKTLDMFPPYHGYRRACKACQADAARQRYANDPQRRALQMIRSQNTSARAVHLKPIDARTAAHLITDAARCAYCQQPNDGTVPFGLDHYMPIKLGGTNDLDNLRPCCEPCNRAKHDSHPDDFHAWLRGVIRRNAS